MKRLAMIGVKIPKELRSILEQVARENNATISEVIREVLTEQFGSGSGVPALSSPVERLTKFFKAEGPMTIGTLRKEARRFGVDDDEFDQFERKHTKSLAGSNTVQWTDDADAW